MPTHDEMARAVEAYIAAFDRADPDAVRDLFAPDASVEDPVGTPAHVGHEAIHAFYAQSMQTGAKLKLEGPVRTAGGTAAFAFSVRIGAGEQAMRIDVIDTFTFNDAGKVTAMRAYFNEANFSKVDAAHA